ncbi:glutathione S-transferase family protein [Paramixta manurensis]|uniref:Glutathione S-transferase family protein n=1 Tax=Paramixta manurensis TaxID=2740817 RepID=A0A6M8UJN5_9GAMM|nr:glutathione S-transferase family protein [Erwiniaceae bacterium PD-1]
MSVIILHHFDASPFAEKLRLVFGLKDVTWRSVQAELIMPKPKLTALTGGYRKTPVMQIGADIYCDSRLIALELEKRYPEPTLFPDASRGVTLALSSWSDRDLHIASSGLAIGVNKHQFPADLMRDREAYFGDFLDVKHLDADIVHLTTQLRAHIDLLQQQLADGRLFFFGDNVGLADFHAWVEIWTARMHVPQLGAMLDSFPQVNAWEARVGAIGHGQRSEISAQEAHAIARNHRPAPAEGVDSTDASGLMAGEVVEVTPDDYGRNPVVGRLVTLTTHQVALERDDPIAGRVVVHFPRIGFRLRRAAAAYQGDAAWLPD